MFRNIKQNLHILIVALLISVGAFGLYWQMSVAAKGQEAAQRLPQQTESIVLGMGCFWGAEKRMAALPGVVDAVSGYAGGSYPDPTYKRVLAAEHQPNVRNHAEVVKVVFDPQQTTVAQVLAGFWQNMIQPRATVKAMI